MRCKPLGYYTRGKGKNRVVHPILPYGQGFSIAANLARMRSVQQHAKRHGLKTGPPVMVPKLIPFKSRAKEAGPITRRARAPQDFGTLRPISDIERRFNIILSKVPEKHQRRVAEKLLTIEAEAGAVLKPKNVAIVENQVTITHPKVRAQFTTDDTGLPEIINIPAKTPTLPRRKLSPVEKKVRKREAKLTKKLKGESGLNMKVTSHLATHYPGRVSLILEQANAAYHYRNPGLEINPEPYELSEGGFIDEALDSLGLPHVATIGS